jgi:hypothetical protein
MPQVTVTGRIVGSDAPTAGVAELRSSGGNAELLCHYQCHWILHDHWCICQQYVCLPDPAPGYQAATGQVTIGSTNYNMGSITINEIALPPSNVVATQAVGQNYVSITWDDRVPEVVNGFTTIMV